VDRNQCAQEARSKGVSATDAWLISHFVKDADEIVKVSERESYQKAFAGFNLFLDNITDLSRCMVELSVDVFGSKNDAKETLGYFIELVTCFFEEMACQMQDAPLHLVKKAEKIEARKLNLAQIQIILLETKDKLNRPYNLTLVSDQMMIRLMEVIG
jgi:hypothetical protein